MFQEWALIRWSPSIIYVSSKPCKGLMTRDVNWLVSVRVQVDQDPEPLMKRWSQIRTQLGTSFLVLELELLMRR